MERKEFITASYTEIERLVNVHLCPPEEYCLPEDEEGSNDSYKCYTVKPSHDKYDEKDLTAALTGKRPHFNTGNYLNELCKRGIIESGEYLISISW